MADFLGVINSGGHVMLQERTSNEQGSTPLGPLVTTRCSSLRGRIFVCAVAGLLIVLGVAIGATAGFGLMARDFTMAWALGVMGLTLICGGGLWIWSSFRRVEFYERGLVRTYPGSRVEILYGDVRSMCYTLERWTYAGAHAGSRVGLDLRLENGRRFTCGFGAKAYTSDFWGRNVRDFDEVSIVRDLVAREIRPKLEGQLERDGLVDWSSRAWLSKDGVTPFGLFRKKPLVAWNEIGKVALKDGKFRLHRKDERRAFVVIPCTGWNFFPCAELFAKFSEGLTGAVTEGHTREIARRLAG